MVMKIKTLLYSWLILNSGTSVQADVIDTQDIAVNLPTEATSKITYIAENNSNAVGTVTNNLGNQAFIINLDNLTVHKLGSLRSDNLGSSEAAAISNDGKVVAGWADTNARSQAFFYRIGDTRMTPIGTFRENNIGYSSANALSGNGLVVAGEADTDSGYSHAFRYRVSDGRLSDLGTLRAHNLGYSSAVAISNDGNILTGNSDTDYGSSQAFFYRDGDTHLTGMGTLRSDIKGSSRATAISSDGNTVIGTAETNSGTSQAFRYNINELKMEGLGTLRSDNSGSSLALSLSADGKVVVGNAFSDIGEIQAFLHNAGDQRMTGLGSLQTDNGGSSYAYSVSADGQVVVGSASTDSGYSQAYLYRQGNTKMTGLGTLRQDNSGSSVALAVNHDGTLIAGSAETDAGETHATLWKIKYPEPLPPEAPPQEKPQIKPEVTIIDVNNSRQAIVDTANTSYQVLDLYQQALTSLSNKRCYTDSKNGYCFNTFFQADTMQGNHRDSAGFTVSVPLLADGALTSGVVLSFPLGSGINNNYSFRPPLFPDIAGYLLYHHGLQPTGFTLDLSIAGIRDDVTIQRNTHANTEAGKGNSTIKGYTASAKASYTYKISQSFFISPFTELRYSSLSRNFYRENRTVTFPAQFERLEVETTELQAGLKNKILLNQSLALNSQLGISSNLTNRSNGFMADIEYVGGFTNKKHHKNNNLHPFVALELVGNMTENSTYMLQTGYQKNNSNRSSTQIGFNLSVRW